MIVSVCINFSRKMMRYSLSRFISQLAHRGELTLWGQYQELKLIGDANRVFVERYDYESSSDKIFLLDR